VTKVNSWPTKSVEMLARALRHMQYGRVVDGLPQSREDAVEADRSTHLHCTGRVLISPEGPIYLDGNSLGRQPRGPLLP